VKKPTTKLLKPSIPQYSTDKDHCQFEEYDKERNAMIACGKPVHRVGRLKYQVCSEHFDYLKSFGKEPKFKLEGK